MKEEKGLGWLYSNKLHLSMSWPPSSLAGGASALISVAIITILFLNCWWFLALPPQPNQPLLASTESGNDSIASNPDLNWTADVNDGIVDHPKENVQSEDPLRTASELCDLSSGEWVRDRSPPLYTNNTCPFIQLSQNCLLNGRPDRGYLQWKWKPFDCELPPFNAAHFLDLMRGKKLVFIGDSLARNHMQALQCSLTQVEEPLNLYSDPKDKEYKWLFPCYNFTLTNFWSPFLVNYTVEHDIYKLNLDVPERVWSSQLAEYDIAIVSTGYWYFRKSVYHVNNTILGASPRSGLNVTRMEMLSALRIVLANVLKHIRTEYKGITMLRTVTVDHFEHGTWSHGGVCNRTTPFSHHQDGGIPPIPWMNNEINKVQIEEFEKAMALVSDTSKLKLINVTYSAYLRPDGHPGPYRIRQPNEPPNDCLHWCLPGPIDMWNQLVLHILQHR
ncbi:hypothetical protein GOP47_0018587 [Adiantum capillus-veneris]|uniref:Trichome birefringence-like N-terminal domain-containing protein n=1 Tax=Adiantum capillus-veneris TaxID=13818 RepID=A0A9D4Z8A9_ADICA|nr:hypothetical protein GOP47_0018587 [Adiantum capillus-veneris]